MNEVLVVGGGLAGSECAWQLAERGVHVVLWEQRPERSSPAHQTDQLAELVCSNSFRGASVEGNAVGLLKEELRRAGSLILQVALDNRVPAGGALAVDRTAFAAEITRRVQAHPNIEVVRRHAETIPGNRPCVIATGPLTSDDLARHIASVVGRESLAYYDAIAPVVDAESIDWSKVFRQSRYDRNDGEQGDEAAYVNCPLTREQYEQFISELKAADQVHAHEFEDASYFEGCLPVEVMAARGEKTLSFGPMKPVGLTDPRTGRRPFAVVQLRPENKQGTAYNLVGFQTRLRQPEQRRVFRMIPGLEKAKFLRYGAIHRNTFIHAPSVLDERLQLRALPGVHLAGQITGVEGYVESTASGLICGLIIADAFRGIPWTPPPPETALGGLLGHLRSEMEPFQPSNITWAHLPPVQGVRGKAERKKARARRALEYLDGWLERRRELGG